MTKPKKTLPEFKTETEERAFWKSHDSTEYVDWSSAKPACFLNLKSSTTTISVRLPLALLERIKIEAHKRGVP